MVRNKKAEMIREIQQYTGTVQIQLVAALMDILIEDYREQSDNAEYNRVLKNQGAIAALKDVKKFCSFNPEKKDSIKNYSGGYQ